jgi:hypothetical protein
LWNCQFLTLLCFQESNNPSPASTQLPDESQLSANAEEQPTQPKRKRGPHSQIYDSFEEAVVLEDGREVFACKTCKKKLTRKDAVTSSLINHQKSCAKKHRPAADQPALSFASVTPRQQELISASLQSFIVGDQQALSLVEQPSFQDFVKTLNPGYKLPSRRALQRDLFVEYDEKKEQLTSFFASLSSKISITSDAWSADDTTGYFAITAHWLDDKYKLQSTLLDFPLFAPPHTGAAAAHLILKAAEEFGIKEKLLGCTSDSASSALKASAEVARGLDDEQPFFPMKCTAHLLNLVVKAGLAWEDRKAALDEVRLFCNAVRNSQGMLLDLEKVCQHNNVHFLKPKAAMEVRWSSTFDQLNTLLPMREAVTQLCCKDKYEKYRISSKTWEVAQEVVLLLKEFAVFTKDLQTQTEPILQHIVPLNHLLLEHLGEIVDDATTGSSLGSSTMASSMQKDLKKRHEAMVGSRSAEWAHILDPFHKGALLDAKQKKLSLQALEEHLTQHYTQEAAQASQSDSQTDNEALSSRYFRKFGGKRAETALVYSPAVQLHAFMAEASLELDMPSYWCSKQSQYPAVAAFVKDLLTIQPTLVPSEVAFSRAGNLITPKRNSLSGRTVRMLMCLDAWSKQVR